MIEARRDDFLSGQFHFANESSFDKLVRPFNRGVEYVYAEDKAKSQSRPSPAEPRFQAEGSKRIAQRSRFRLRERGVCARFG